MPFPFLMKRTLLSFHFQVNRLSHQDHKKNLLRLTALSLKTWGNMSSPAAAAKNGRNHILCKIPAFGKFSHQFSSSFQHCEISPVAQIWSFLSNFSHKIGDFCPIMLSCDANVEQSQFQLIFREFPGYPRASFQVTLAPVHPVWSPPKLSHACSHTITRSL